MVNATKKRVRKQAMDRPRQFVSTGSTLLNLACSGRPDGGFMTGHYYLFVGDSDSGKTWLCLTAFAEATINEEFAKYRLIYDAPEGGALMDLERFFGARVAKRLEPPSRDEKGNPVHSETVQDFYFNVDDALEDGRPFIYVLDSQDALSSREEQSKFAETKAAVRAGKRGKEIRGSYGDGKAGIHSRSLRKLMGPLAKSGSILIVINQTRDSFDMFSPKTYSGGHALKFYATLQLWSAQAGKIKRDVNGNQRQLGIYAKVRVKKNRVTGQDREVKVPIYHSFGIDDVGSMVDFLVAEKHWAKPGTKIIVTGLGPTWKGTAEQVIRRIDENDLADDLREIAASVWKDVEKKCAVVRKSRYAMESNGE